MQGIISKAQTIGMIIALISTIGGGFYAYGVFANRLDAVEKNVIKIEKKKFTINETVDLTDVYSDIKEVNNKVNEDIKELNTKVDKDIKELNTFLLDQINGIAIKIEDLTKGIERIKADVIINSAAIEYLDAKINELKAESNNPLLQ
jgi:methyl-accepting chemotaxis protein